MIASSTDFPSDRDLCDVLIAYLAAHPHATDTLDGIIEWWLPNYPVRVSQERIRRALSELEARGLVERVGDVERPLFRLRRDSTALNP